MVNKVDSWRFTCLLSYMKLHIILFSIVYEHLWSFLLQGTSIFCSTEWNISWQNRPFFSFKQTNCTWLGISSYLVQGGASPNNIFFLEVIILQFHRILIQKGLINPNINYFTHSMWADMLESSLCCKHWKGFVAVGTNKCEKKRRHGVCFHKSQAFMTLVLFVTLRSKWKHYLRWLQEHLTFYI